MKQLIRLGKANDAVEEDASSITSQVTGAIDWCCVRCVGDP